MKGHAQVTYIGRVRSELTQLKECPCQGKEGAPPARIEIFPEFREALKGIRTGAELVLLTWFHRSSRDTLRVHPRGNPENPLTGVFLTRSPDRPNPIGLHEVRVMSVDKESPALEVAPLEALDNTPVIDIKISWSPER